jgi:transporter family-2 protein
MKGLELSTLILLGLGIGVAMASQAGVNAQLRQYLHSPYQAAFFSFVVGAMLLGLLLIVQQTIRPSFQELLNIPAWLWLGGLLGAFSISTAIIIAPRLGAASFTIVVVCGQLIMSLILDHFGWLGFDQHPINWQRVMGATLVVLGLVLTQKY